MYTYIFFFRNSSFQRVLKIRSVDFTTCVLEKYSVQKFKRAFSFFGLIFTYPFFFKRQICLKYIYIYIQTSNRPFDKNSFASCAGQFSISIN